MDPPHPPYIKSYIHAWKMLTISKNLVSFMTFDLFHSPTYLLCRFCSLIFYTSFFHLSKDCDYFFFLFFYVFIYFLFYSFIFVHFLLYNHMQHIYQSMLYVATCIRVFNSTVYVSYVGFCPLIV